MRRTAKLLECYTLDSMKTKRQLRKIKASFRGAAILLLFLSAGVLRPAGRSTISAQTKARKTAVWQPIEFGIVKFNDQAPNSWNIYHGEKKGLLLVHLWK